MANFWCFFWAFLGIFLGVILGSDGHRAGKMSIKEPSTSSKSEIVGFSKTLKNLLFFSVFGCRGFPRECQEPRYRSQETPKETPMGGPKLGEKVAKKVNPKMCKKNLVWECKKSLWPALVWVLFMAMGLSKMAHCEDVKKLLKMLKNGPNMIKKRFKIV